jgi:hypothetical protein
MFLRMDLFSSSGNKAPNLVDIVQRAILSQYAPRTDLVNGQYQENGY